MKDSKKYCNNFFKYFAWGLGATCGSALDIIALQVIVALKVVVVVVVVVIVVYTPC